MVLGFRRYSFDLLEHFLNVYLFEELLVLRALISLFTVDKLLGAFDSIFDGASVDLLTFIYLDVAQVSLFEIFGVVLADSVVVGHFTHLFCILAHFLLFYGQVSVLYFFAVEHAVVNNVEILLWRYEK